MVRARHQATAAWAAKVLQPETTTRRVAGTVERAEDPRRDRVVVPERGGRSAGHVAPLEEDGLVRRLDVPVAPGDRARRVDRRSARSGQRRDAVEERRPVRCRLGRDEGDPGHRRPSFQAALRTFSRQRNGGPGLRWSRPRRRTWLASWIV